MGAAVFKIAGGKQAASSVVKYNPDQDIHAMMEEKIFM
jgi:hypothetical protein